MQPATLLNETRAVGKPTNWNEEANGPCSFLSIHDSCLSDPEADYNIMTSAWKPNEEELQILIKGGHVYLGIFGITHPVVHLYAA